MPRIPGLTIIKKRFQSVLQFFINATPTFHYGFALFSISFLFGLNATMCDLLAPTSSDIFALRIWKLVSSPFVEPNFFIFVWSVISLQQFIVYIEPSWSLIEVLKYLGIVQLLTTVFIMTLALISFETFEAPEFFFHSRICGLPIIGICALVSLKQFLPDTVILTTPYGRLKNANLPLSSLFVCLLLWIVGLLRTSVLAQVTVGLQVSWTYLRFFRVCNTMPLFESTTEFSDDQQNLLIVGDENEHFSWANLFPRRLQPVANIIGNATFHMLVVLKICKRLKNPDLNRIDGVLQSTFVVDAVTMESRDAERKRQRALRVLNERLSGMVSTSDNFAKSTAPSLSSTTVATRTREIHDSSTDENPELTVKNSPQQEFTQLGHRVAKSTHHNSDLNENLYGVVSPFTNRLAQEPSRLLAQVDSDMKMNDAAELLH